jgi:hypothetical protein
MLRARWGGRLAGITLAVLLCAALVSVDHLESGQRTQAVALIDALLAGWRESSER